MSTTMLGQAIREQEESEMRIERQKAPEALRVLADPSTCPHDDATLFGRDRDALIYFCPACRRKIPMFVILTLKGRA